jgi:hypothetical protein
MELKIGKNANESAKKQIMEHFKEIKARFFGITGGKETIVVLEVDLAGMYPALRGSQNDITVNCTSFANCSLFGSSANGNRTRI